MSNDPSVDDLLAQLGRHRSDYRAQLADLNDRVDAIRHSFAEKVRNDPQGLPVEIAEALVAASGPDSPVACQRVRAQVDDGLFTWQELYADPESVAGPEGRQLVNRARRFIRPT